jgi:hypothetical protein
MNGTYAGQGGFNIEFHQDSAVVGCGQAAVAHTYIVEKKDPQVLVTIEDAAKPIALAFRPDGRLAGSGSVEVNGRAVAGTNPNGDLAYAPRTATCAVGILTATQTETAAVATPTATSGVPAAALPNKASASTSPTGSAGNAVLSIATGFTAQPGVANPLATGHGFVLLKDSFEKALTEAGLQAPAGMSPLKAWVAACNNRTPDCQQGLAAGATYRVADVKMDGNGKAQFSPLPPGTYYLFGSARYNNQLLLWNLRVDLRPGANSVSLDQRNAASLN